MTLARSAARHARLRGSLAGNQRRHPGRRRGVSRRSGYGGTPASIGGAGRIGLALNAPVTSCPLPSRFNRPTFLRFRWLSAHCAGSR